MATVKQGIKYFGVVTVKDKHRYTLCSTQLCRLKLCNHSARASVCARTACDGVYLIVNCINAGNKTRVGVLSRVGVVKAINVRKVEKKVGVADLCYVCRKNIVSTKLCKLVG